MDRINCLGNYKYLLLSVFTILTLDVLGQKEANWWYFGAHAGLNFNKITNGLPEGVDDGDMDAFEANSTISDANGNLLFYTDGRYVWDASHDTMPNGKALFGHPSTTQCLIVPNPGNSKRYYIFSMDYVDFWQFRGFGYSEVDMTLRGGLGDVITSTKNTNLVDSVGERITAIKMRGQVGYWLIVHQYLINKKQTNQYLAYAITPAGINPTPVISNVGPIAKKFEYASAFKASPCGGKIATIFQNIGTVILMDFDAFTGKLSNARVDAQTYSENSYGIEFSGDGSKLYTARSSHLSAFIHQYSTQVNTSAAFIGSKIALSDPAITNLRGMQRGPDSKVYFMYGKSTQKLNLMGVIHKPNEPGIACDLSANGPIIPPNGDLRAELGLPNFVTKFFCPDPDIAPKKLCFKDWTIIALTGDTLGLDSVLFNYGDPLGTPNSSKNILDSHKYSQPGTYQITAILYRTYGSTFVKDTITKTITISEPPHGFLGKDIAICPDDTAVLKSTIPFRTYSWNTGSSDSILYTNTSGEYILTGDLGQCPGRDSMKVNIQTITSLNPLKDTVLCESSQTELSIPDIYNHYQWSTGSQTHHTQISEAGMYWIQVDSAGCKASDTLKVDIQNCECKILFPNVFSPNEDGYNDQFTISSNCQTVQFSLNIFNRWGKEVFSAEAIDDSWNGNLNGFSPTEGVYFWVAKYQFLNGSVESEQGHVLLVSSQR